MTLIICSSLDINIAFERSFAYLREFFPLDEMFLDYQDPKLGAIRQIACRSAQEYEGRNDIIPLPKEMWDWALRIDKPLILDSGTKNRYARAIAPLVKGEGKSDLVVPLRIEGKSIGVLVLRAEGDGVYKKDHADLISLVSEPFAIALSNALAHQELLNYQDILLDDNRFFRNELSLIATDDIIGYGSGLRNVMEMVGQVAPLNNTVLLMGETGVGKEVIANAIHHGSARKEGPFIKVNCGAIPETLIDSELFGHEKGAFTGALQLKRGRFERAEGGTLFLDEIGELPLQAQVRLLRVLENRELERVGGTRSIPIDIRIIAATHQDLQKMTADNRFRQDLWFRINAFPIFIPPLRQRREDIPALTRHFVQNKSKQLGLSAPPAIAPGALDRLSRYDWPGNVRELQNIVEREIIRYKGDALSFELSSLDTTLCDPNQGRAMEQETFQPMKLDDAMAQHIRKVIKHTKGRINGRGGAAELLGINPATLRSRMQKLGINRLDYLSSV